MCGRGTRTGADGVNFMVDTDGIGTVHHLMLQKNSWFRPELDSIDCQYWVAVLEVCLLNPDKKDKCALNTTV